MKPTYSRRLGTAIFRGLVVAVATTALVVLAAVPSRAEGEIAVNIVSIDDSGFPDIVVVLTADVSGRPLVDLRAAEITAEEGGAPAAVVDVVSATSSDLPLALVIVIDTSGSMAGSKIVTAKQAAAGLIAALSPRDMAAVISFSNSARVEQGLTGDRAALQSAIDSLQAAGNTALYDAVAVAATVADASGMTRRAVVLLSDGLDFGGTSTTTREAAIAAAAASGALFYTVGVGPQIDGPFLDALAAQTRGAAFLAPEAAAINDIYRTIEETLRSQYVVRLRSTSNGVSGRQSLSIGIRRDTLSGDAAVEYATRRAATATPTPSPTPSPSATPSPTPLPTSIPTVTATPAPSGEPSGGGGSIVPAAATIGAILVLAVAGAGLLVRRRRRTTSADESPAVRRDLRPLPLPAASAMRTAHGVVVVRGPGFEATAELADEPVTLGTAADATIRLQGARVAPEHVRFWWRDGALMIHHLASGYETVIGNERITWARLDPGDEVRVGEFTVSFRPANAAGPGTGGEL